MSRVSDIEERFILDALRDDDKRKEYREAYAESVRHGVCITAILCLATIGLVDLAWLFIALALNGLTEFDVGWGVGLASALIMSLVFDKCMLLKKRRERIARSI